MALALDDVTKFEWDSSKHYYVLRRGNEVYSVRSNGKINYYPWASSELRWMVIDRSHCPFNGEECFILVEVLRGEEERAREIERELKQYILKMEEE